MPSPRELIALAVAVTLRCGGCIATHAGDALKHGAKREEIAGALGVAVTLNAGAAMVYLARVMGGRPWCPGFGVGAMNVMPAQTREVFAGRRSPCAGVSGFV